MANDDYSRDPDCLHDDMVVARFQIVVRHDGGLGVSGNINAELKWIQDCFEEAKKLVARHQAKMNLGKTIVIPGYDAPPLPEGINLRG